MGNWQTDYAESDQWEVHNQTNTSHRVHVARAGATRDHEWYALLYIDDGEHFDRQYSLGVREEFPSKGEAIRWSDGYCNSNPDGHADDIVAEIRANKQES